MGRVILPSHASVLEGEALANDTDGHRPVQLQHRDLTSNGITPVTDCVGKRQSVVAPRLFVDAVIDVSFAHGPYARQAAVYAQLKPPPTAGMPYKTIDRKDTAVSSPVDPAGFMGRKTRSRQPPCRPGRADRQTSSPAAARPTPTHHPAARADGVSDDSCSLCASRLAYNL